MLPLRKRLDKAVKSTGKRLDVLQQDYLLSWVLAAISQHPKLHSSLIFKGGTALKKCYFGDYRFSEDLDFSANAELINSKELLEVIIEVAQIAQKQAREYAPLTITAELYTENEPHPDGQEAFRIRGQFSWQREPLTVVMIEITRSEILLLPPYLRPIIHEYGEPIEQQINVYSLEEIVIEKLRAILQHTKKLHERDWNRSRARDYYDLWSIFHTFGDQLKVSGLPSLLEQKCTHREVSFTDSSSFFNAKMLSNVQRTWHQWLGPLVPNLPAYETVMGELRPKIDALLNNSL